MKRILFLVPRMNIGGAETYVYTAAVEMKKRGYDVYLVSGGGKLADKLESIGVKTFFLPIRHAFPFVPWLLKRIIKKYNIDIIHANSGAAGILAAKIKRDIGIPVIYTAHGIFGNPEREYIIDELDTIICVSEYVRQDSIKRGFSAEHLIVRYSGIDTEKFEADEVLRYKLRKNYGFGDKTLVLAIVSRIKDLESKGHQHLLNIMSTYAGSDDWKVMVIGKGNGVLKLRKQVLSMGLKDKVVCLGHKTDVEKWLNAADLLVLPSKFETFGLVLAEGMAMGKPAITFSVGGTPEVVADGVTGFLIEKDNEQEMYEKIKVLDENRELMKRFSENGVKWVRNHFTNIKMADDLEKIYQSVEK